MSLTTAFIAELISAANEADRLTTFEIKGLLNRSIADTRHARGERDLGQQPDEECRCRSAGCRGAPIA
ncbi:hypothetical protein GGE07_001433 [Sinorhizobium terangae]|nr:hypothetical protein [Sinorhizobium terangae]MBB4184807.1 hypothetical protein [Sinorhizobium terangae]WFU50757.1 hypothetical protein QA637_19190 [Sinorhizobium terangae]